MIPEVVLFMINATDVQLNYKIYIAKPQWNKMDSCSKKQKKCQRLSTKMTLGNNYIILSD